jgi:hypothetical protein
MAKFLVKKKKADSAPPDEAAVAPEKRPVTDEEIARVEGQISVYIDKMWDVSTAEGLFEPKIKDITDYSESLASCIKKRDELVKAKAEQEKEQEK